MNPSLRIGAHFREVWLAHRDDASWQEAAGPLLESLRIPPTPEFYGRYPGQLSVGMAQRVVVALGLLHRPRLLIADEPTSALDLATQRELLALLRRFRSEQGLAVLFISHDLLALMAVCDRIAVLRSGDLIETVPASSFFEAAQHPYTQELGCSLRDLMLRRKDESTRPASGERL